MEPAVFADADHGLLTDPSTSAISSNRRRSSQAPSNAGLQLMPTRLNLGASNPTVIQQQPRCEVPVCSADMSQQGQDAAKRSKKRKLKQVKPILEQLPAVPADAQQQQQQQQHKHKRQHRQPDKQEPQQQQEQQPDALGSGNSKFARALGSTDFHTREQGLQALSRWLTHKQLISEVDMLKLWKGIYFCFWHSDKEPVQEDLAERLSGLIPRMQPAMAQLYWSAMLCTLRSEWFALDRHRLNKFLMLVRKFVAAVFTRLAAADWDVPSIRSFTSSLPLVPHDLIPVNSARSLGLSYHLADIWLPELRATAGQQALPAEALVELLVPFQAVLQQSGEAALVNRVRESVFEGLVQDLAAAAAAAAGRQAAGGSSSSDEGSGSEEDEEDGSSWGYCQELDVQQYAALLFDSGAQTGVKARNREALYATSKDLERVAGKRRKAAAAAAGMLAAGSDQPAAAQQQQQQKAARQQQLKRSVAKEQEVSEALKEGSTGGKKKEKKQQQEQQQQTQAVQNGVTPQSSKKRKKQQQVVQEPAAKAAPATAAAAATRAAAVATPSSSRKVKKHHKDAAAGSGKKGVTPAAAAGGSGTGSSSAVKRGVKIDLQHNLYFEHGAPPPAADVRTPPRAKPKGSALKAAIKLDSSGRPSAPHTAPPAVAQQQGQRRVVTPKSVPRLKAAEFF